jgi:hypothetical protein
MPGAVSGIVILRGVGGGSGSKCLVGLVA